MAITRRSTGRKGGLAVTAKIPRLVKRNTILLAASQALVGAGMQLTPTLGPLLAVELLGSAALAGAAVSIVGISRFAVAYPLGKIMDVSGRRTGLMLGLSVAAAGTVVTGLSVIWHSFAVFILGMLIFGAGVGAAQQLRLAGADMYPPRRRAEGLGYVLTGSLVGVLGGPLIITVAQAVSPRLGLPVLATPWLLVPAVIIPSILLVSRMRPDPKEIAANLERYYPDYVLEAPLRPGATERVSVRAFLRHYPKRVAFVASFAAQGTMAMTMAMTSLSLAHHGHALAAISLSVAIHVVGMFAFSLPLGRVCDLVGRRSVLGGGAVIAAVGALLVPVSAGYWVVTLGTFLVGLGWSCVNVAATAVIADTTQPQERGRAIGTNDAFASASGFVLPLVAGPLVDAFGLGSVGLLGGLVMVAPLPMLLRLRESAPGRFDDLAAVPEEA